MPPKLTFLPPFEKDLARASTLSSRFYKDPDVLAVEKDRLFARTWQPVARLVDVEHPGDQVPGEVAGEPVVVVRDRQGVLRAFYNVCRHRAGPVSLAKANRNTLQCRYHGWTYGLDGALLQTPDLDGIEAFDRTAFGLVPVAVAAFGPFVFVNLDGQAEPLAKYLGDIPQTLAGHRLADMRLVAQRDYTLACNWKVYVDNYLEGYHVQVAHPSLAKELDMDAYRTETFRYHSSQHAPLKAGGAMYGDAPDDTKAFYFWVFPNWMINVYPDNMSINVVVPLDADRTLTVFEWYAHDGMSDERLARTVAFSDQVQQEDIGLCEAVSKRLGSRSYDAGRFSPRRENGVHHFQGLWHEFMSKE